MHSHVADAVQRDGVAIVPGALDLAEITTLLDVLHRAPLKRSRAGVRHILSIREVAVLANGRRLMDIAKDILDNSALPFRATLFDKSPSTNWLVMWHQDTALPLRERRSAPGWGPWSVKDGVQYAHAPASALGRVVALRVHLDDSTTANGPLRVLPGTHTMGVLDDAAVQKLVGVAKEMECTVPAGGVVAMRPLVVHASSKSTCDLPRRVLHIEYSSLTKFEHGIELAIT